MASVKVFNLSGLQFPHLKNGVVTPAPGLWAGLHRKRQAEPLAQCLALAQRSVNGRLREFPQEWRCVYD